MLRFLGGVIAGILIAEKYDVPRVDIVTKKLIKELDDWTKKDDSKKDKS